MANPFPVRLRAASIVPRWSIVHTLKPDYVAGHSFFVALYSAQIARLIDWKGGRGELLWEALTHDVFDELVVGDIVGPVKSNIIDPQKFSNFVSRKVDEMMPGLPRYEFEKRAGQETKLIVKAADQLDALFYALGEQALGNQIIAARVPSCYDKAREAWFRLPGCEEEGFVNLEKMLEAKFLREAYSRIPLAERVPKRLADLWLNVIVPAIDEHRNAKNYDIQK